MTSAISRWVTSIVLIFCALGGISRASCLAVQTPAKLFVNVVVLDPSEAISRKLGGKIETTKLPNFMKMRLKKRLSAVASKAVKPNMVAQKMSSKMSTEMPKKMATKGISVDVEEHFREGPYFVLQLQVRHVDSATLAEAKCENKSIGARVQKFLTFIGAKNQDKLENYLIPGLIEKKLPGMMTEMMSEKLAEKGVIARAKVLPEKKQQKFFDAKLLEIRGLADRLESAGEL